ncbi:hypothetical protein [Ideonella sp. YS5]|uniref:hypothetical protein n=1 Tax=Ideonella sp. YS5 TaxID=3453714 RepID=UPI003EEE7EE0
MSSPRRRTLLLGLFGSALLTAGCATEPVPRTNADGTYCFRIGKTNRRTVTCTPSPIPSEQIEAEAKRFAASQGAVTVYVVRKRWADAKNLVRVSTSDGPAVDTVPNSFARLRLAPGAHRLTATWADGSVSLDVSGSAGDVVFVELIGSTWAWGSRYRMGPGGPVGSHERAAKLRLVADAQ